jgi:hypothetical protein
MGKCGLRGIWSLAYILLSFFLVFFGSQFAARLKTKVPAPTSKSGGLAGINGLAYPENSEMLVCGSSAKRHLLVTRRKKIAGYRIPDLKAAGKRLCSCMFQSIHRCNPSKLINTLQKIFYQKRSSEEISFARQMKTGDNCSFRTRRSHYLQKGGETIQLSGFP